MPCRNLKWIHRKHSNDVEIPGKITIFVARQIYFVVCLDFHVTLEVTLSHDSKICEVRSLGIGTVFYSN